MLPFAGRRHLAFTPTKAMRERPLLCEFWRFPRPAPFRALLLRLRRIRLRLLGSLVGGWHRELVPFARRGRYRAGCRQIGTLACRHRAFRHWAALLPRARAAWRAAGLLRARRGAPTGASRTLTTRRGATRPAATVTPSPAATTTLAGARPAVTIPVALRALGLMGLRR